MKPNNAVKTFDFSVSATSEKLIKEAQAQVGDAIQKSPYYI